MKPYEKLSSIYDGYWGKFSDKYFNFLMSIKENYNLNFNHILELACGTGNLICKLSEIGEQLVGIDISPHMLNVAREKAKYIQNINFILGDFQNFSFEYKFDLILCCFDSLNYIYSKKELTDIFKCVERNLKKDGYFIFDVVNEKHFLRIDGMSGEYTVSGSTYKNLCKYNKEKKVAQNVFIFEEGEEIHKQIPIEFEEIEKYLKNRNLYIIDVFDSLNCTEVKDDSGRYYFIIRKK